MARFLSVSAVLMLVLVVLFFARPPARVCDGCNVVLISIDTLGAKHMSVYDTTLDTTPNLAALANANGIVFENAYAQAPWTLPSHTAMLTGRYPWEVGVETYLDALPRSLETVAESFGAKGYRTGAFSRGSFVQPQWQFDQGFSEFYGSMDETSWNDAPELFVDAAKWITKSDEPFFLFIHSFNPHDPYGDPNEGGIQIDDIVAANTKLGGPTKDEADRFRLAYHDEIRTTDGALADFFKTLKAEGHGNDTIVLITSDHGEEFGEHGTAGFHSVAVYDESVHVPLMLFIPGAKSARIPETVEVRSVPATLLESVGIAAPKDIGESLLPLVHGTETGDRVALSRTSVARDALFASIKGAYAGISDIRDRVIIPTERTEPYTGPYTSAVRQGTQVVMRHGSGEVEAFERASDPTEQKDVAGDSSTTPSFKTLLEILEILGK